MTITISEPMGKVSRGTVTVTLNGNEMASFDLEGRLLYYAIGPTVYRRSIYNQLFRLEWHGGEERIIARIDDPTFVFERAYTLARETSQLSGDPSLKDALKGVAERTTNWLSEDAKKVRSLYGRISIVPPDLYFSTYLQLTTGCTWNLCTFCNLYKDRTYSVKTPEQFLKHIRAVQSYLGKGVAARRSVFLGDANAMDVSQKLIEQMFVNIAEELENPPIYSFVDAFTTPKNLTRMDFGRLHGLGLRRVYLGLESGDPRVLKILNKPMNLTEAKEFVAQLKSVGVNLGVIILIGAGGHKYWDDHVNMSCKVVEEMNLGIGDIVYLSPLIETQLYTRLVDGLHLGTLYNGQKENQMEQILQKLKQSRKVNCPVVRYDIRESFVS
jgi:radical SAM superfamily enzyme YgiQ (UPF0313 family)